MPKSGPRGFTLLELLVVLCVLICLMALLVPNFYPVSAKSKYAKALNQCKAISDAMMNYTTVRGGTAVPALMDNGGVWELDETPYMVMRTVADIDDVLIPEFISRIPPTDPWGNDWEIQVAADDPMPGPGHWAVTGPQVYYVRSHGANGTADSPIVSGPFPINDTNGASDDVVCADGAVVQFPEGWSVN